MDCHSSSSWRNRHFTCGVIQRDMPMLFLFPPAVSFCRQSSKPRMCCLISPPCQPQSGMVADQGEEPPLPQCLFPPHWSWRRQAAGRVPQPLASSKSSALPTLLQEKSYHMYTTKSFSYFNLFFPAPEAFVSKQDASIWGRDNGVVQLMLRRRAGNSATAELLPSSPLFRPLTFLFWFSDIYLSLDAKFPIQHIYFTKRLAN